LTQFLIQPFFVSGRVTGINQSGSHTHHIHLDLVFILQLLFGNNNTRKTSHHKMFCGFFYSKRILFHVENLTKKKTSF
jgi:hypothetical protein